MKHKSRDHQENTLGQIKWEQMVFLGNPEYGVNLQPSDFAAFAHTCREVGFSVEDSDGCGRSLTEFLAAPGPTVLQGMVDPFESPMPVDCTPGENCSQHSLR